MPKICPKVNRNMMDRRVLNASIQALRPKEWHGLTDIQALPDVVTDAC